MEKIRKLITIEEDKQSTKSLFAYIAIAYLFALSVRYIWVYLFQGEPNFIHNGELMINTNDGYAWAEAARDILRGGNDTGDLSNMSAPIAQITAFLATILPIKFETLILWMPAVFGSLLVIPVVLIGHTLKQTKMGFVAALLAGIAWSYYNRTMVGYYDTDLLVIVFPTLILWATLLALTDNKNRYLLITSLLVIAYRWYYPGSYSLLIGLSGAVVLYALLYDRKNLFNYKLVLFILAAAYLSTFLIQFVAVIALFALFHFGKERTEKVILPLLAVTIIYLLFNGVFDPILGQLESYVFRKAVADEIVLKFFSVVQTVREAGEIPFEIFANRISGHMVVFVLSVIGTLLMLIKYPSFLVALPMIGLGFLAYKFGLRFTVYAVPILALGMAFLIFFVANYLKSKPIKYLFISLATVGVLYPNVKHVYDYKVPTVFNKQEVEVLKDLEQKATGQDYVVTWWDYGFPIRYYADVKTLVDGAKHSGYQNFAPSFILTAPNQEAAAKMARLEVEYTEKIMQEKLTSRTIALMAKDYGYQEAVEFLSTLPSIDISKTKKTRDIYLYLPNRMMNIFPTVNLFSNIDIRTGERLPQKYFSYNNNFQQSGGNIQLRDGSTIVQNQGIIQLRNQQQVPIKDFFVVTNQSNGTIDVQHQKVRPNGFLNVIFMRSYNAFLVVDNEMLNSTYVQLFVFENYDKDLFEPVSKSPYAKVYKLKI